MPLAYQNILRPILYSCDAEEIHETSLKILSAVGRCHESLALTEILFGGTKTRLPVNAFGLNFPNPVGLAAGFDKNAVALPFWHALGFGFVEIGTVTALPQPGNPRPRIWRLPNENALVNRLGFPSEGADAVAERLARFRDRILWPRIPVGINIGKSAAVSLADATEDYLRSFNRLLEFGDFFVINVSSPNTPHLRELQERARLEELLGALQAVNRGQRPLLLKISPDLTLDALDEIIEVCQARHIAGIVATNTTTNHSQSPITSLPSPVGGLSGRPLRQRSTELVRHIAVQSKGKLPIIGVGGITSGADALEKIRAGASLVELYTGFVYEGPCSIRRIVADLRVALAREGFLSVDSARATATIHSIQ